MIDRKKYLLDIVVPTYNRKDLCRKQVISIMKQLSELGAKGELVRVYILDNASEDSYRDIENTCKDTGFIYHRFRTNTASIGNQCRSAIYGTSRYTWILSDDDALCDYAIAKIMTALTVDKKSMLLLLNDRVKHAISFSSMRELVKYAAESDPLMLSSNTLISSIIFDKRLFDARSFWQNESTWFPLAVTIFDKAASMDCLVTSISSRNIFTPSNNTRSEREKRILEDPECNDAFLDRQFQTAILYFLNLLRSRSGLPEISKSMYIDIVCKSFGTRKEQVLYGMEDLEWLRCS